METIDNSDLRKSILMNPHIILAIGFPFVGFLYCGRLRHKRKIKKCKKEMHYLKSLKNKK